FTAPRASLTLYLPWRLRRGDAQMPGELRLVEVVDARPQAQPLQVQLRDIDTRDAAQELVGSEIVVPRSELPDLSGGGHYWTDLEGMRVVTMDGIELGTVAHLFATGANDVLVVRGDNLQGKQERLIPFTPGHAVVKVDSTARTIEVDWDVDF
ncbi:MAG: ribosome maturation factor RimM, partial [Lysobacterales bacterium]